MLNTAERVGTSSTTLEMSLAASERLISQIRARQVQALRVLDREQVASRDGARCLQDWVAARLDVGPETARELVSAVALLAEHPAAEWSLADGDVSFDRAIAMARLAAAGASDDAVKASEGYDIAGVRRLAARRKRVTPTDERRAFADRYVALQPSLDESSWRLAGMLPGIEGHILDRVLTLRGDELPPPVEPGTRGCRNADALVALAQDWLDPTAISEPSPATTPMVSVFVDWASAEPTDGEAGVEVAAGPRLGPAALERMLCEGRVRLIGTNGLRPVAVSTAARAIPPATRSFVLHRDGECVVAGCSSRYRLQPHHVTPFSRGGTHAAENLATLCWYHHHVAVHGSGFRIDPESPPGRRRLIRPPEGPGPPRPT